MFLDSLNILYRSKRKSVIVSASFVELIGSFCKNELKITLVANSLLNYDIDINHSQKVKVLKARFGKDLIILNAYGNSAGDFDMLNFSEKSFFRTSKGKIIPY